MLSIVATPIGNLGDITLRAIETLKVCDIVVCEDTRVTGNLIKQLDIKKKEMMSFHGYSDEHKLNKIIDQLNAGKHLCLVSDAGTPSISDPGYALVKRAQEEDVKIEVIPGPSAFLAALSGSGLPIHNFVYLGFPPAKKGRKTWLESLENEPKTIVFYESVHRIEKTLNELAEALKNQPDRPVVIARELTKIHEQFLYTKVADLESIATSITKKGEFVIMIGAL